MRKIIGLVLSVLMIFSTFSFTSCGKNNEKEGENYEEPFSLTSFKTVLKIGETYTITYKNQTGTVVFESENDDIATVDENGNVKAKNLGSCKIFVNDGQSSKFMEIVVFEDMLPVNYIRLYQKEYTFVENSENTFDIDVYCGKDKLDGIDVLYESSDSAVATVENGKIKAKSFGSCEITATANVNGETVSNKFTVNVVYKLDHSPRINAVSQYGLTPNSEYDIEENIDIKNFDGTAFVGTKEIKVYSDLSMNNEVETPNNKFIVENDKLYKVLITATNDQNFVSTKTIYLACNRKINGIYDFNTCDFDTEFGTNRDTVASFVDDDLYGKIIKVSQSTYFPYCRGFVMKNLHNYADGNSYVHIKAKFDNIVDKIYGYTQVHVGSEYYYTFSETQVVVKKEKQGQWVDLYYKIENPQENNWTIEFFDDGQMVGSLYLGLSYYIAEINMLSSLPQ